MARFLRGARRVQDAVRLQNGGKRFDLPKDGALTVSSTAGAAVGAAGATPSSDFTKPPNHSAEGLSVDVAIDPGMDALCAQLLEARIELFPAWQNCT
jgi:hypothetical protein